MDEWAEYRAEGVRGWYRNGDFEFKRTFIQLITFTVNQEGGRERLQAKQEIMERNTVAPSSLWQMK